MARPHRDDRSTLESVLGASRDPSAFRKSTERAVVLEGDCLVRLKELPDGSVHCCVCDPPYGLSQREVDMFAVLSRWLARESYQHGGGGFQNAAWDSFVPGPEVWREVFRVLKPGGYLVAFGAPRCYDLLALSIRLAGFTVRDSLHWVYANGNGGTKSHNLSLAIDKAAGRERRVSGNGRTNVELDNEPATEEAKQWLGWGTSVAPAHEPIIVAQKPVEGTYAGNLLEHGVGGLNIDGCKTSDGAWPKNILYGHSADCNGTCVDGCPVAALDAQHGKRISDRFPVFRPDAPFRYCAKPSRAERNAGLDDSFEERSSDPREGAALGVFAEKGGAPQKNHHPTTKPVALMAWLCRLVTPPGGVVLDPYAGSGSTGCGAVGEGFRFVGIELDPDFAAIARARVKHAARLRCVPAAEMPKTARPESTPLARPSAPPGPAKSSPSAGLAKAASAGAQAQKGMPVIKVGA